MEKTKFRAGTLLSPVPPALVTCGDENENNILTVAWTGILNSDPPKTYVSVRPTRHSHHILREKREFVINLTPAALVRAADLCGTLTGAKVDKFQKCRLTRQFVEEVSAPLIAECPVSLCCRVSDVVSLGSHDMFLADIAAVYVNSDLLDAKGKLHVERAGLCAYAHGDYFALGKKIGSFGFSVRKKPR